jgi:peptide/nickel transport system permease protein
VLARRLGDNLVLAAGLGLLAAVLLLAVAGPCLVSADRARVGAVRPTQPPSAAHWFGTDTQGRDVFTALVLAAPRTLEVGLLAGGVGLAAGVVLGLAAGFSPGRVDTVIRVAADVLTTIPGIAVLVLVATYVRAMSVELMALVIASLAWVYPTRAIRAQTLSLRERAWIQVARLNGVGELELLLREVLPNLLPYIAASFVTAVAQAILASIGLEALGLGPQNAHTLGMMIYWSQFYGAVLRGMWWWWGPPIALIALIFLGLLLTSTGLDRLLDARARSAA